MTKREMYEAIVAGEMTQEIKDKAAELIKTMDEEAAKRKAKADEKKIDKMEAEAAIVDSIVAILDAEEGKSAHDICEVIDEIGTPQKATVLVKRAVADGRAKQIDMKGEQPMLFNFVKHPSKDITENGIDCPEINVVMSPSLKDPVFKYDPETNLYYKEANHKPQIDETNGEQLALTNVFVFFCDIHQKDIQPDLRDATFTNGGIGYYLSNGKLVTFKWTQENKDTPFKLYNDNDEELEVNIGKSYICIVDNDYTEDTTYKTADETVADEASADMTTADAADTTETLADE